MIIKNVEKIYGETPTNSNIQFLNTFKVTTENESVWFVPLDEANTDYQAIQEWIADGNTVIDNKPE